MYTNTEIRDREEGGTKGREDNGLRRIRAKRSGINKTKNEGQKRQEWKNQEII